MTRLFRRASRRPLAHQRARLQIESLESRRVMATISGAINTNTILDLAGSPWDVTGDITVNANATLKVDPGVVLRFATSTGITVAANGRFVAEGTPYSRISFGPVAGQNWD